MLINVCIIETGGVVGTTPRKHINRLFCSTPEAIACLNFKWSKSTFYFTFNELLSNKVQIEMKQEVWWVHSLIKVGLLYFIKYKNDMYAPAAPQKPFRLLAFKLSK